MYLLSFQSSKVTTDAGAIQKATDFVQAFMLGFDVEVREGQEEGREGRWRERVGRWVCRWGEGEGDEGEKQVYMYIYIYIQ